MLALAKGLPPPYAVDNLVELPPVHDGIVLITFGFAFARHAVAPKRTETSLETPGSCMVTP